MSKMPTLLAADKNVAAQKKPGPANESTVHAQDRAMERYGLALTLPPHLPQLREVT